MNKNTVNLKMETIKAFFNLDNNKISNMLDNKIITKEYDFSKLKIQDVIKITRELSLSLDVLEEIFCNQDDSLRNLNEKLELNRTQGILRKVDELGRIVIPMEFRNFLNILEKEQLGISIDFSGNLILKPQKKCAACGRKKDIINVNDFYLCKNCIESYTRKHKMIEI